MGASVKGGGESGAAEGGVSWKPEVLVQGQWSSNALVFATKDEAWEYAHDLESRWTLVMDIRAVRSEDTVTHKWNATTCLPERVM